MIVDFEAGPFSVRGEKAGLKYGLGLGLFGVLLLAAGLGFRQYRRAHPRRRPQPGTPAWAPAAAGRPCRACGTETLPDTKFCGRCGVPLGR